MLLHFFTLAVLLATTSQVDKFPLMKSSPSVDVAMNLAVFNNNFTLLPFNIHTLAAVYKATRVLVNEARVGKKTDCEKK